MVDYGCPSQSTDERGDRVDQIENPLSIAINDTRLFEEYREKVGDETISGQLTPDRCNGTEPESISARTSSDVQPHRGYKLSD